MRTHQERLRRLGEAARASEAVAAEDRAARDAAIEEADQDHVSVREIARAVGMSPSRVHSVILERTAARQARIAAAAGF